MQMLYTKQKNTAVGFTPLEGNAKVEHSRVHSNSLTGFTLVELLVAVMIFSVVMVISVGSLLSLVSANRKAQNLKTVINNLSFGLDSMTRSIRNGTIYHCGAAGSLAVEADCAAGSTFFAFEPFGGDPSSSADQVVFCRGEGTSCSSSGTALLRSLNGGVTYAAITAPEVIIESLAFYVVGTGRSDHIQPKVVFVVRGHTGTEERTKSSFTIQTTVTQRLLDE